jgi:hypothetical protein
MRRIWAAISGLVWVVACGSVDDPRSPGDTEPESAELTGAAGEPNYDATNTLERTTGDKRAALFAIHDAWQLIAALDAKAADQVADTVVQLAFRGDDVSSGPAEEAVGSSRSALSEPPNLPPDPGSASCDRSGCSFDNYRRQFGEPFYRLQGTLRFDTNPAGRLLSIDLFRDDSEDGFDPEHISGSLLVGDTTLDGGVSEISYFPRGPDTQALGFSELTFEPGAFLPEATPLSGKVLGIWHSSGPYPEQIALIPFP